MNTVLQARKSYNQYFKALVNDVTFYRDCPIESLKNGKYKVFDKEHNSHLDACKAINERFAVYNNIRKATILNDLPMLTRSDYVKKISEEIEKLDQSISGLVITELANPKHSLTDKITFLIDQYYDSPAYLKVVIGEGLFNAVEDFCKKYGR